jgi:hypothetical protein
MGSYKIEPADLAPTTADRKAVEEHAKKNATPDWLFNATKVGERWAIGAEVTEQDYRDAVNRTANHKYS